MNYKLQKVWKRSTLFIWLAALGLGAGAYLKLSASPADEPVKVTIKNFEFDPKEVTIKAGQEVEWTDQGGRHSVQADDGSFKSPALVANGTFKHKFTKAGRFMYFCEFHGSKGGHDMAGVVIVTK